MSVDHPRRWKVEVPCSSLFFEMLATPPIATDTAVVSLPSPPLHPSLSLCLSLFPTLSFSYPYPALYVGEGLVRLDALLDHVDGRLNSMRRPVRYLRGVECVRCEVLRYITIYRVKRAVSVRSKGEWVELCARSLGVRDDPVMATTRSLGAVGEESAMVI